MVLIIKDPFLKPVIFGGLIITMLSIIFAPAIFLWSVIGGFIAIRMVSKLSEEVASILDSVLVGLFTGVIGGTCINILAVLSFRDPENKRALIQTLEKNWPPDMTPMPNFAETLTSILFTTCLLIIGICVAFSILGSFIGYKVNMKKAAEEEGKESTKE